MQWIIDLRKEYIHRCRIHVGYQIGIDDDKGTNFILRANGPSITTLGPPLIALGATDIIHYAQLLIGLIGDYVDRCNWQKEWELINNKLLKLPINPEPEFSNIGKSSEDEIFTMINKLNERYIGEGLKHLR